jgi:hypothetical protein
MGQILTFDVMRFIIQNLDIKDPVRFSQVNKLYSNHLNTIWKQLFMIFCPGLDLLIPGLDTLTSRLDVSIQENYRNKYMKGTNLNKMIGTTYSSQCIFTSFNSKVETINEFFKVKTVELHCDIKRTSERFGLPDLLENLKPISNEVGLLTQLKELKIHDKIVTSAINGLINLEFLEIYYCDMNSCLGIENLPNLEFLKITSCHMTEIPQFVFSLPKLCYLNVSYNPITSLHVNLLKVTTLCNLNVIGTEIKKDDVLDQLRSRIRIYSD